METWSVLTSHLSFPKAYFHACRELTDLLSPGLASSSPDYEPVPTMCPSRSFFYFFLVLKDHALRMCLPIWTVAESGLKAVLLEKW